MESTKKKKRCFDEKISISKNFWWGSAASGPQTEGRISGDGKGENIFDYWYKNEPQKFFDQVGPEKPRKFIRSIRGCTVDETDWA